MSDPARCTGFSQHPVVTGGKPINGLAGLGSAAGGYHRSHGQLLNDSGGYTILTPDTWLTAGLDLMVGAVVGSLDSVVGYVFGPVCFVYTCGRLIGLSLIAGTRPTAASGRWVELLLALCCLPRHQNGQLDLSTC